MEVTPFEAENDQHRRIERAQAGPLEIRARVELQAVFRGLELIIRHLAEPSVGVGFRLGDLLPVAVWLTSVHADAYAGRGRPATGVEDVGRDAHCSSTSWSRIGVI